MLRGLNQAIEGITGQPDVEIIKGLYQYYYNDVVDSPFEQGWLSCNWVKQVNEWNGSIDEFFEHYKLRLKVMRL